MSSFIVNYVPCISVARDCERENFPYPSNAFHIKAQANEYVAISLLKASKDCEKNLADKSCTEK